MKNQTKNIAASIIISGLFFVPVFCSAQVNGVSGSNDDNSNVEFPSSGASIYDSQAEAEAEEELYYLEGLYNTQFSTDFENFDQKSNQLFNILSTVLKARKEMASATIRNIN